jgi:hypothetical protein
MLDLSTMTIQFHPTIAEALEKRIWDAWKELCRTAPPDASASAIMPYSMWIKTWEGKFHHMWISEYFMQTGAHPARKIDQMYNRLQSKRYALRGKGRLHSPLLYNRKSYRAYKEWYLNKIAAEYLGAEFSVPCPIIIETPDADPKLTMLEMAYNFERYTGEKLPPALWEKCRRWDAEDEAKRVISGQRDNPAELQAA